MFIDEISILRILIHFNSHESTKDKLLLIFSPGFHYDQYEIAATSKVFAKSFE